MPAIQKHIELLKEYEKRLALQSWKSVEDLIHEDAYFIFSDGTYRGKKEIEKVFTRNFNTIKEEIKAPFKLLFEISGVKRMIAHR